MRKFKNQNGITLIALVITIIVMLILVAVTITMAVNGGLFDYARRAGQETNRAIEKEQQLADLEANLTVDDLIDKYTTEYTLADLGLEIGDEIDYNSILESVSDYTAPASKTGYDSDSDEDLTDEAGQTFGQEELTWQVMRQKGDNIILVASTTTKGGEDNNGMLCLGGAEGWLYGPSELNNICKALYSYRDEEGNIIAEARSINEEDVLYLSGYNPASYIENDDYYGLKLSEVVESEEYTKYPYNNKGTAEIRDGFPDNMLYDYYQSDLGETDASDINKELISINGNAYYWLASSCAGDGTEPIVYSLRLVSGSGIGANSVMYSDGEITNGTAYFRPVVVLPSSIVKAIIDAQ